MRTRQPALPLAADPAPTARPIHVSGYVRQGQDFYATPDWVTAALLHHVPLRGPVWEPCCGDGAMVRVLTAHGHAVVASDITDRGFGTPGVDFLACRTLPEGCRSIVTNPPYGETTVPGGPASSSVAMLGFLDHALALTAAVEGQLALLVRLQWLAGRRAAARISAAPCAAVVVLTRRIRWFDMGARTNQAQHHHAWVVFDYARPAAAAPVLLYGS